MSTAESERPDEIDDTEVGTRVGDLRVGEDFIVFEKDHTPTWIQSDVTRRIER